VITVFWQIIFRVKGSQSHRIDYGYAMKLLISYEPKNMHWMIIIHCEMCGWSVIDVGECRTKLHVFEE